MTSTYISAPASKRLSYLMAYGLLGFCCTGASAADFSQTKKLYVPPSQIDRRVDFASLRENATTNRTTAANQKGQSVTGSKTVNKAAISQMNKKANSFLKEGKVAEAQETFAAMDKLTPGNKNTANKLSQTNVQQAQKFMNAGDFHNALTAARQAIAIDPSNPEAHNILSQLYRKVGANPDNPNERLSTAHALYQRGQYLEAEVEYKAALAIRPSAEGHVGLGKVAEKLRGPQAAKDYYCQALSLDPNSAIAHRELGMLHHNSGDVITANAELSKALTLDSKDSVAGQSLIKLWQEQVTKAPSANSHLGLARAYQLTGDLNSAQNEYRQVVQTDPNHPNLPAARQSFQQALAKQDALKNIAAAQSLEAKGSLQDAFQQANLAVSLDQRNMNHRLYQGYLLEKLGQQNQARQVYTAILNEDPANMAAAQRMQSLGQTVSSAGMLSTGQLFDSGGGSTAGFPGSKFGTLFPYGTPVSQTMPFSAPVAPGDHVGVLANFMGAVREQMFTQKEQWQAFEDLSRRSQRNQFGKSSLPTSSGNNNNDDYISKILSSPVGSPLPGKSAPTVAPMFSPVSSTQAAAIPAVGSLLPPATPVILPEENLGGLKPALPSSYFRNKEILAPSAPTLGFDLMQVQPTLKNVQLNVVLRNNSATAVSLPKNMQALIRYPDGREAEVKADFKESSIPANGSLAGIVRVPFAKADANADLILRNLDPSAEIHLNAGAFRQQAAAMNYPH
ncbi:MAG: tetratricopeptide repeat protein [Candidatus Obscuribacterales bacterium]|nr:tetratricopeptide repeat protein [Candidatus Obscuribacterales bacterium]